MMMKSPIEYNYVDYNTVLILYSLFFLSYLRLTIIYSLLFITDFVKQFGIFELKVIRFFVENLSAN